VHQICARSIDAAANVEIDSKITGFAGWLKILANRFEELTVNFFVDRQLRIEFQLPIKGYRSRCRETNICRMQEQLVNHDQAGVDAVFYMGLFKMKLSQLFDLKNLAKQHEHAILLDPPVTEENLAFSN